MRRTLVPLFVASLGLWLPSCARKTAEQTELRARQQATLQSFQPITYRRTGSTSLASEDRIVIDKDGAVESNGRVLGTVRGHLSELQRMQLATLFEGWDRLETRYAAPQGAENAPVTVIQYGEKSVTASDAAANLPEQFKRLRQRLESLVRQLPVTNSWQ